MMKKKSRRIVLVVLYSLLLYFLFRPMILKNTVYPEIENKITSETMSSNVYILQQERDGSGTSYSVGFGGVVFKEDKGKYYILTASHAIENIENAELVILRYDDKTVSEQLDSNYKFEGIKEHYSQFPIAKVEYYDKKYDLAILSFEVNSRFNTLSIAKSNPKYNEKVVAISSPMKEKRNLITYGRIKSIAPRSFGRGNEELEHNILRHSAYINVGSSGSALLDENLDIVGINLGGGTNILKRFVHGMAIPCEEINKFINDWQKIRNK